MDFSSYIVDPKIPSYLPKMQDLYKDLFSSGKFYRGRLVEAVAGEMGLKAEQSSVLSRCVEFIHNSSLLHDDIIDGAHLRRGKTTSWKKYGSGYAILSGDYLLARVIKDLSALKNLNLVEYTSESILSLVEGEWLQDACHQRLDVTNQEMARVHELKTSSLFSWCFKAPAFLVPSLTASDFQNLEQVGLGIGSLLQRSDDLLDFDIRNSEGKSHFQDAPSGYFNSFMIDLLKGFKEEDRAYAFKAQNLNEFLKHYKIDLQKKLKDFDEESVRIVESVKSSLAEISFFSEDFKKEILLATENIYWRV